MCRYTESPEEPDEPPQPISTVLAIADVSAVCNLITISPVWSLFHHGKHKVKGIDRHQLALRLGLPLSGKYSQNRFFARKVRYQPDLLKGVFGNRQMGNNLTEILAGP